VCTGGEPLLQLDETLVRALHCEGFEVAIQTNGTLKPPVGIDWICVSPKAGAPLKIHSGNELKLVFPQYGAEPDLYENLEFDHFLLQPMYGSDGPANTELAIAYCKTHPRWRLSLQTHKILRIP
jgi:organic radical activating enzyme